MLILSDELETMADDSYKTSYRNMIVEIDGTVFYGYLLGETTER